MAKRAVVAVGVVGVALGVAWLIGMRNKDSAVVAAQRRINKRFVNPRIIPVAGRPGAPASLVRHVGRTSGTSYETPVGAIATDDGFVVPLVYGSRSDWVQNVLAADAATIRHEGQEHEVTQPELVPLADAAAWIPDQRSLKLFGVRELLRVRTVPA